MKSGNLNFLEPSGPLQAYNGTALPFTDISSNLADYCPSYVNREIKNNNVTSTVFKIM
jgi:hypothetical protein